MSLTFAISYVLFAPVNSEDQPVEKPNIRWTNLNSQINGLFFACLGYAADREKRLIAIEA
jgi:hypothetical protein